MYIVCFLLLYPFSPMLYSGNLYVQLHDLLQLIGLILLCATLRNDNRSSTFPLRLIVVHHEVGNYIVSSRKNLVGNENFGLYHATCKKRVNGTSARNTSLFAHICIARWKKFQVQPNMEFVETCVLYPIERM